MEYFTFLVAIDFVLNKLTAVVWLCWFGNVCIVLRKHSAIFSQLYFENGNGEFFLSWLWRQGFSVQS